MALWATNILEYATNRQNGAPYPLGVLYDPNNPTPLSPNNALVWPPALSASVLLGTNTSSGQFIVPGQSYYLTVTNPNRVAVTFALDAWFDITSLTNCEAATNFVGPAGIPRYFQFDVPTNQLPAGAAPQQVSFWLSSAESNVTVVLSQHLPLPDLTHYDYISQQPSTNNEIIMLVTNTTPFPIQANRWYVGVFNSMATNVSFLVQACYFTNDLVIIPLTNGVPFTASISNQFVAPPGPPRSFFLEYDQTNYVDAILFELYGLSGDADLVLQRGTRPRWHLISTAASVWAIPPNKSCAAFPVRWVICGASGIWAFITTKPRMWLIPRA